ncbi:MAG: zinc ribbon domain-containing protein [Promethearchaeota archaeon]
MNRKEPTWFGINLSKKQATNVFILSLAGLFLLTMIIVPFIFSFINSIISAIKYGGFESWILYSLMYMLPYLIILLIVFSFTIYTLVKSRKIAIFYSGVMGTQKSEVRLLSFCPNCGNKRTSIEKFCRICGEEFK